MKKLRPSGFFWPLLAVLLLTCLAPASAAALDVVLGARGDVDVLTLEFDAGPLPAYAVKRSGRQTVAVELGGGETMATGRTLNGGLVNTVGPVGGGLVIELKTDAFGYITVPGPGPSSLQIQFFRDPIGAKWRPQDERPAPAPEPAPAPVAAPAAAPEPAPAPATALAQPAPEPAPAPEAQPVPEVQPEPGAVAQADLEPEPVALPEPVVVEPEPAPAVPAPRPEPEPGLWQQNFFSVPYAVRVPVSRDGPVQLAVAPSEVSGQDADTGEMRYKAVKTGPEEMALPEPVIEPVAEPLAEPVAEPTPQPVTEPDVEPVPEPMAEPGIEPVVQQTMEPAPQAAAQAPAPATVPAGTPAAANATQREEEARYVQSLELQLLKAQAQIASGNLEAAKTGLEILLADPLLPDNLRQESLYGLAGVLSALYSDDLEGHFDEIQDAYQQAMNADLASPSVPGALFHLGLLNLRVDNLPEARAYFGTLRERYPHDENIPALGYYWGEYWFRKGEYQPASDAFQTFIETYPENERLARQSAYLLAESLNRLGLYDQAYQIVDYIDKRWPQAHEENPDFLRLAGDVEYRLGLYDQAKDDYWTYYNMNPKAERADVVMARLGDTYLEVGKTKAAKEMYQRAIRDYEGMDGALIAKMRLAEEGIYDEPAFLDMVTVFDRPYNKRPLEVYTEIADEHPDSSLAPLALLKMGMWHHYQGDYPEALTAVRRLLDEYPRSELVDRAKELADRTFGLAVPGFMEQGQYDAVVDYWENYGFAEDNEGIDNATKISVAQCYHRLGDYTKALDLVAPFLTAEQAGEDSEMALALALNVYLDQQAWTRINEVTDMVRSNWELSPRLDRLIKHANAVAYENLGQHDKSVRLWAMLGADSEVEPFIRADALYYLAKEAMNHQDLKRVFVYAQEALVLLSQTGGDRDKIKDSILMSIYATERSGRYQEALRWAQEYADFVTRDDPEWAAAQYKLAQIYDKVGANREWSQVMEAIREKEPDSLYGRLAATALETERIANEAQQYAPVSN